MSGIRLGTVLHCERRRATSCAFITRVGTLALIGLASLQVRGADTVTVTGTVIDAHGNPVPGARVGSAFTLAKSVSETKLSIGYGPSSVVTDASGRFAMPAAPVGYSQVLVAAGPDGTLGFAKKAFPAPTEIPLAKPSRLKVVVSKAFGHGPPFGFDLRAGESAVGYGIVDGGTQAEFVAPAGSFEISMSDNESKTATRQVRLTPSLARTVQIQLRPAAWARSLGKPAPPFTPTDLQNWPADQPLTSLRGKWVLVSFWATWCRPCVEEMPELIRFYEQHSADRSRFEILAVHSADGPSLEGIRTAYDRLVQQTWGGKRLPFPLLFDATGNTQKRWGIDTYPTTLLIDPSGKLVGLATLEDLQSKVGG
jgi:thiol-disulfide isomerase/thioredoxin